MIFELTPDQEEFWQLYVSQLKHPIINPVVEAAMPGNESIADELVELYLIGKKTAGSSLHKSYLKQGYIPKIGDFWMMLDSQKKPRCIAKLVKIEIYPFSEITEEIAIAEGEGDLSLKYWSDVHREFWQETCRSLGIAKIEDEDICVEYVEVVYPLKV